MQYFELTPEDISSLNDGDLRELVGRLSEAELAQQGLRTSCVTWGGAQEATDGGIDVQVRETNSLNHPDFVPRQFTVFQIKKHTMGEAACKKEMQNQGVSKPIISELAQHHGAYIIVSGKDDCSPKMLKNRLKGMQAAVNSLESKEDLKLDFYGRDRVAAWLRQHPGVSLWVRHKLGKPLSGWQPFGRWAATPDEIDDQFLADEHPSVLVANSASKEPQTLLEGIKVVREKLRTARNAVRITGLSGVGKTRFAQALFEEGVADHPLPKANAIYADLGDDLTPVASELAAHFIANNNPAYLVLDNCPPDIHSSLHKKVAAHGSQLRLLTIEYDISEDKPEQTEVVHLEPSSESSVSKLVQRRHPDLGQINADKISEFSGGNARIALALASRVNADETLTNFSDEALFERLFSQRKGQNDNLLEAAEILSLVYSFNASSNGSSDELKTLACISGIDRKTLHRSTAELLRRQIAQKRGNWRAVLPHALANRLARRALENIPAAEINAELFKADNLRLLNSCAHRIGYLHDSEAARELADSWVAPGGPLFDANSYAAEQLACLEYIAPVFPETVLTLLYNASKHPEFATRSNGNYGTFVRILCHLAYEDEHFDQALELLLKFAENEKKGENVNNIVSRIRSLFSLYLSGTQATPARRQAFVERMLTSPSPRHQEIAVELLNASLNAQYWSSQALFGFGARKRGSGWKPQSQEEKSGWYVGFVKVLETALHSNRQSERKIAQDALASNFRSLWNHAVLSHLLVSKIQLVRAV